MNKQEKELMENACKCICHEDRLADALIRHEWGCSVQCDLRDKKYINKDGTFDKKRFLMLKELVSNVSKNKNAKRHPKAVVPKETVWK